ncbi:response regulator [Zoogloea sp.]|jgi:CheY-like chemotaxis protein|uniref:ATP-binding response regulator n=1 Tax=Zoogloea sp. TaxID=49181 RepID=UPI0011D373BF|nr:response regulator [Zoogloea sp.]MBK6656112.1 response regulator [Zoogloea sp.]MBK7849143.1 response regulator [Zoogloea sp.]MBP7444097.1 response regulator [Zoogloea sp.]TXG96004.1 MAG: response regulator [Zoogloea sp.]HOY01043.1 response regulator [Zoogloea sp.]
MSKVSILVVDDEPFNLDIVAEYLDEMDFDLVMVESGEAAWVELSRSDSSFDLVLLDRMMPGMDGIMLLKKIKADDRLRSIPVIMQTAATSPEQVREGLAAGAFYYLTKPFEGEALQTIIRSALDDMRVRRELKASLADHEHALACLTEGSFSIRTLEEARALASFIALLGAQPETLAMGLSELLVNGVEHGNLGIDFAEKSRLREADRWEEEVARRLALDENRGKSVRLRVRGDDSRWTFEIHDDGPGFDWRRFLDFDPERAFAPNGRGIALSRQLSFASLTYLPPGNQVVVTVAKPERHAS